MRKMRRFAFIGALAALLLVPMGSSPSMAQSRAHVYLLRGLMNIFSLGMDDLAQKIEKRGIYATVHNHSEWQTLADSAAAAYKAGKEGPIILIGHSLGADAVMEMAQYLGRKGIPVALVVPFDGTQSFSTPSNVARLVNITQRDYAYMRKGAGFKGSLYNMDVSSDQSIGHISIDKSPRLHAQVIGYVLAAVGGGTPHGRSSESVGAWQADCCEPSCAGRRGQARHSDRQHPAETGHARQWRVERCECRRCGRRHRNAGDRATGALSAGRGAR